MVFLLTFSYFIMTDFRFKIMRESSLAANESNSRVNNESLNLLAENYTVRAVLDSTEVINGPTVLEIVLIIWIFSFTLEEIRQV